MQCVECGCLHSYLHKTCNSQLLLIIMHARQLLHDLGHTLYESLCGYIYRGREFSEQTLNEYESSIMVIHHNLKTQNVLVHTHTSQKLQDISEHFDMRYVLCGHVLKSMLINTMLLFTYSRAVQYGYNESAGMYVVIIILWSSAITTCTTKFFNFPTNAEMVVDQLQEAGYTNISRQYFSVSALVFSLDEVQLNTAT